MPFIHLLITKGNVTRSQKQQLVKDFTDSLVRVLGKKPEHTHIVIEEVDTDNWGFAGMLTTDYRKLNGRSRNETRPSGSVERPTKSGSRTRTPTARRK
jgi:4-oxalocrotonate tautomerase